MRRRVGFLFIILAAVPVAVFASTAWACGALATLTPSKATAQPGETISVTGRNFRTASATTTDVQVRLDSRDGPILTRHPGGSEWTQAVRVPPTTGAGWHVLVATQFSSTTGVPVGGTPARTTVRVQGDVIGSSTAPWGAATPPSSGPGSPDVPLPGILLSVAMLATGLTLVFRDRGRKARRSAVAA